MEELDVRGLEDALSCDSAVILLTFLQVVFYDDVYHMARMTDEFIPIQDLDGAISAIDNWFLRYGYRFRQVFAKLNDYTDLHVSDVIIKHRYACLELSRIEDPPHEYA